MIQKWPLIIAASTEKAMDGKDNKKDNEDETDFFNWDEDNIVDEDTINTNDY